MAGRKRKINGIYNIDTEPIVTYAHLENLTMNYFDQMKAIEDGFLMRCPPEFLVFYELCKHLNPLDPLNALAPEFGLVLVGPFEVIRAFTKIGHPQEKGKWILCNRYYHDPPELVTLLVCKKDTDYHIGYFRDEPGGLPVFVAGSSPNDTGALTKLGPNLFSMLGAMIKQKGKKVNRELWEKVSSFSQRYDLGIDIASPVYVERSVVCPTMNGVGLAVRLLDGGIGYRPLQISHSKLIKTIEAVLLTAPEKQIFRLAHIDEFITLVQFANDEGDFGAGLELGLDLLAFHPKYKPTDAADILNKRISHLLGVGYELAGRHQFATVIRKHMENRVLKPKSIE